MFLFSSTSLLWWTPDVFFQHRHKLARQYDLLKNRRVSTYSNDGSNGKEGGNWQCYGEVAS